MALPAESSVQVNLFGRIIAAVNLLLAARLKAAHRPLYPDTDCNIAVGFQELCMNLL